jgi:protein-L-isoaspartate(D-aspartate) O-methyltransferase
MRSEDRVATTSFFHPLCNAKIKVMQEKERNTKLAKSRKKLFHGLASAIRSKRVLAAMERVPREDFVPADLREMAYLDIPLAIGEGQTISQPYIVAMMTEALQLQPNDRVLEVGTGSGYQAAMLAELVPDGRLVTVELVAILRERAQRVLNGLGYTNIVFEPADETLGCPARGRYDAIIVTAAAPNLPHSLLEQLEVGGRMVIPVGTLESQELVQVLRTGEGFSVRMLGPCRFVLLLGPEGFPAPQ